MSAMSTMLQRWRINKKNSTIDVNSNRRGMKRWGKELIGRQSHTELRTLLFAGALLTHQHRARMK